jgi:voltage-gated potassium channel
MLRTMRRIRVVERYREQPSSGRLALQVIVAAATAATLLGGLAMWVFDRKDFSDVGDAMWWSLQTVTTVGYGDNPPTTGVGRMIAAVVLLHAVGFMAILTAVITTSFVERARRDRNPDEPDLGAVLERLDLIVERLDRLEQRERARRPGGGITPEG